MNTSSVGTPIPLFKTCFVLIIAMLLLVLFLEVKAHAEPRTLEQLLEQENYNAVDVLREKGRLSDLETQCDCEIVNGVKIHGYPGAWSARNRARRDRAIDIYIHGNGGADIGVDAK